MGFYFLLCINNLGWTVCKRLHYEDGGRRFCFIFDATYLWLWEIVQKKNTPITLLVLELDKQLVFCVSGFHFMYDLFFFFYIFIMPALLVRCSERRSGGCWVVIATVKQANAYQ